MIRGSCHCGSVTFELSEPPEWLTICNCSLCRRVGALWAHVDTACATVTHDEDATFTYVQGEKRVALHTCKTCGCTTHWTSLMAEAETRVGINCRLAEPDDIAALRVRHFDGADKWEFTD
ncbi:MAG: GFA family protein [Proteobacteria bacterium]|nr:GFA family protein [Pseudomonadota bacterium]